MVTAVSKSVWIRLEIKGEVLFLSQMDMGKRADLRMKGGKSRLWKTAGFSIALGESLMTSRPLIQSLRLDWDSSSLPCPFSRSLTLSPVMPILKKQHEHTEKHSGPHPPEAVCPLRKLQAFQPKRPTKDTAAFIPSPGFLPCSISTLMKT